MTIRIDIPTGWEELGQKQLKAVFGMISRKGNPNSIKARVFLWLGGIEILHKEGELGWRCRMRGGRQHGGSFLLSAGEVASALPSVEWIETPPSIPVGMTELRRHRMVDRYLRGVSFGDWMTCENNFQGFIHTNDDEHLREIAAVLYPGLRGRLKPWENTAVFYLVSSMKLWLRTRYPHFFAATSGGTGGIPDMRTALAVQIRALTKGDITKESAVLSMDVHSAFFELDSMAREYEELDKKIQ